MIDAIKNATRPQRYSGEFFRGLAETVHLSEQRALHAELARDCWHETYFATGMLLIEPWELIVRVRNAMSSGANNDGVMSPGAAAGWLDLEPLQTALMREGFES